jgi:hypothetical protein
LQVSFHNYQLTSTMEDIVLNWTLPPLDLNLQNKLIAYNFHYKWAVISQTLIQHHFTKKGGVLGPYYQLNPVSFHWSVRAKKGKWAVMYLCIGSIDFDSDFSIWILEMFRHCGIFSFSFYFQHCINLPLNFWAIVLNLFPFYRIYSVLYINLTGYISNEKVRLLAKHK